jgi:hypothetical protein
MKIAGILVMVTGIGLAAFSTFSYFTREKVFQIGNLELTRQQPHSFNWSPFIGISIIVIGAFLILKAKKK